MVVTDFMDKYLLDTKAYLDLAEHNCLGHCGQEIKHKMKAYMTQ